MGWRRGWTRDRADKLPQSELKGGLRSASEAEERCTGRAQWKACMTLGAAEGRKDVHIVQQAAYVAAGACEMSWLGNRTPGATVQVGPAFAPNDVKAMTRRAVINSKSPSFEEDRSRTVSS